jgi:hypothetical protein
MEALGNGQRSFLPLPPSAMPRISPSRGEIGKTHPPRITLNVEIGANGRRPSVAPLEGEMPGMAEGGNRGAQGGIS